MKAVCRPRSPWRFSCAGRRRARGGRPALRPRAARRRGLRRDREAAQPDQLQRPRGRLRRGRARGRHPLAALQRARRSSSRSGPSPTSRCATRSTPTSTGTTPRATSPTRWLSRKQVAIVSSEATRAEPRDQLGMERVKQQLDGRSGHHRGLAEEARRGAEKRRAGPCPHQTRSRNRRDYLAELKGLELTLPDLTFDKSMILHRRAGTSISCSWAVGTRAETWSSTCRRRRSWPPATCSTAGFPSWATAFRPSGSRPSISSASSTSIASWAGTAGSSRAPTSRPFATTWRR